MSTNQMDSDAGDRPVALIVVADEGYQGQEAVAAEVGGGFDVQLATSLDQVREALLVADGVVPLVLVPYNLAPIDGAQLLGRLAEEPEPFVGMLMVDAPDLGRLSDTQPGVHSVLMRPLRSGQLRLLVGAAAQQRRAIVDNSGVRRAVAREMDKILRSLRHELRGQLQGIIGLSGLLIEFEGDRLSAEGLDWCQRIERGGENLAGLVDAVVAYLRLGRRQPEIASVDLSQLVEDVFDGLRMRVPRGSALNSALNFSGLGRRVRADRGELALALEALVHNGVTYNVATSPTVTVSAIAGDPRLAAATTTTTTTTTGTGTATGIQRTSGAGKGVTIIVSDNGVGITEHARPRLFEPFERREIPRHDLVGGAGLGLATVSKVMQRAGGEAWFETEPDKGSRFYLYLPNS